MNRRHCLLAAAPWALWTGASGSAHSAKVGRTAIQTFHHSAFPYEGVVPHTGKPFLDVLVEGRRGHMSSRGGTYFEDETYQDRQTLLHVGSRFKASGRSVIVLFFHGNNATLREEVVARQRVVSQFEASGIDGVLVAPQLARNALDSSAGRFWEEGFLDKYLEEAAERLAGLSGVGKRVFRAAPIILVAYSGGYLPVAYSLESGDAASRIRGVVLMDALFGESGRFLGWVEAHHPGAFFVSAFGAASRGENRALMQALDDRGISKSTRMPTKLRRGAFFLHAPSAAHLEFMTAAWVSNPLRDVLARIR